MPIKIAVEKLRGFVADHQAKIVAVEGNEVRMEIEDQSTGRLRRITDRSLVFNVDLSLEEERLQTAAAPAGGETTRTRIHVSVSPRRNRDRRRNDVMSRAREVLVSFRSYMMASEEELTATDGTLHRTKRLLASWLG